MRKVKESHELVHKKKGGRNKKQVETLKHLDLARPSSLLFFILLFLFLLCLHPRRFTLCMRKGRFEAAIGCEARPRQTAWTVFFGLLGSSLPQTASACRTGRSLSSSPFYPAAQDWFLLPSFRLLFSPFLSYFFVTTPVLFCGFLFFTLLSPASSQSLPLFGRDLVSVVSQPEVKVSLLVDNCLFVNSTFYVLLPSKESNGVKKKGRS